MAPHTQKSTTMDVKESLMPKLMKTSKKNRERYGKTGSKSRLKWSNMVIFPCYLEERLTDGQNSLELKFKIVNRPCRI